MTLTTAGLRLSLLILAISCLSCVMSNRDDQPVTGASSFDLEPREERALIARSNGGDNEASLRLYRYYDFVKLDRPTALKWLMKSAKDENPQSQYILAKFLLDDPKLRNVKQGKRWMRRSAQNAYPEAKKALESL